MSPDLLSTLARKPYWLRCASSAILTQQHHLDALALRSRYLPSQRSFQPPHLGFAALDHLLAPNQMAKANHTSAEENNSPSSLRRLPTKKLSIQAVLEVVLEFNPWHTTAEFRPLGNLNRARHVVYTASA